MISRLNCQEANKANSPSMPRFLYIEKEQESLRGGGNGLKQQLPSRGAREENRSIGDLCRFRCLCEQPLAEICVNEKGDMTNETEKNV